MADQPACSVIGRSFERFRSDLRRRYPQQAGASPSRPTNPADQGEPAPEAEGPVRLQQLPPEIGALLIIVGTAGILLPGPVGSPFLIAGGVALWPTGFRKVERWFMKVAPGMYTTGIKQIEHFLDDLERRFPGSTVTRTG